MKNFIALLLFALIPQFSLARCENELMQLESQNLPADQLKRNREWYEAFKNDSEVYPAGVVVKLHLEPSLHSPGELRSDDRGAVSACILRYASESRFSEISSYAREGYALRLLNGYGVKRDPELAMKYLERAARSDKYGSAAVRLARIQLQGNPTPTMQESGVSWALMALQYADKTPGGSINPREAIPLLRKVISQMLAKRDIESARNIYQVVEGFNLANSPQEEIAKGYPQIREGSIADGREKYANSPRGVRRAQWRECYEARTQQRASTMDYELFEDDFKTNLFKAGVVDTCGRYPK